MPLDSILIHKEKVIKTLPKVTDIDARRLLAESMNVTGVYDKAHPTGTPVASATITLAEASIVKGTTTTASVAVLPAGATNKSGTFVSTNKTKATVDPVTGVVTGVAQGSAIIIWVAGDGSGVSDGAAVTITNPPPPEE